MTIAVTAARSDETLLRLGPQGEGANSSEYFPNTPGTHTMTNTPNPGDQAGAFECVLEALSEQLSRYGISQTGSIERNITAKILSAIPTPPPAVSDHMLDMANVGEALMEAIRDYSSAEFMKTWRPADCPSEIVGDLLNALEEAQTLPADHTDLIARATDLREDAAWLRGFPLGNEWNANGITSIGSRKLDRVAAALCEAADALQAHASPRELEAVSRLLCGGDDPDELVEAGNPMGEPCDYPRWMLYQLDARKIIDTLGATCTRREVQFEAALREIENPIAAMQKRAEAEGSRLDGPIALSIANDPEYLKRIARTALELG